MRRDAGFGADGAGTQVQVTEKEAKILRRDERHAGRAITMAVKTGDAKAFAAARRQERAELAGLQKASIEFHRGDSSRTDGSGKALGADI